MFEIRSPQSNTAAREGASSMLTCVQRLFEIDKRVSKLVRTLNRDPDATPALAVIVRELQQKSKRAVRIGEGASAERAREIVIELEQIAERAEWAVRAGAAPAPLLLSQIGELRACIGGLAEDLVGNDSD